MTNNESLENEKTNDIFDQLTKKISEKVIGKNLKALYEGLIPFIPEILSTFDIQTNEDFSFMIQKLTNEALTKKTGTPYKLNEEIFKALIDSLQPYAPETQILDGTVKGLDNPPKTLTPSLYKSNGKVIIVDNAVVPTGISKDGKQYLPRQKLNVYCKKGYTVKPKTVNFKGKKLEGRICSLDTQNRKGVFEDE
jgi:hypothetical protein